MNISNKGKVILSVITLVLILLIFVLFNKSSFETPCGYSGNIPGSREILTTSEKDELLKRFVQNEST